MNPNPKHIERAATIGGAAIVAVIAARLAAPSLPVAAPVVTREAGRHAPESQPTPAPDDSPCKAQDGKYASLSAVATDGCQLVMAERPASLIECGDDRTSVIVRRRHERLLVIRCELAKEN